MRLLGTFDVNHSAFGAADVRLSAHQDERAGHLRYLRGVIPLHKLDIHYRCGGPHSWEPVERRLMNMQAQMRHAGASLSALRWSCDDSDKFWCRVTCEATVDLV